MSPEEMKWVDGWIRPPIHRCIDGGLDGRMNAWIGDSEVGVLTHPRTSDEFG